MTFKRHQELRKVIERASALQKRAQDSGLPPEPLMDEVIEELLSASEELLTSQETLFEQEDALLKAQDETKAEQQRYQQLFELAPDGYVVTDLNGVIKIMNRVVARMIGIDLRYVLQKPLAVYVAPDDRIFFRRQLNLLRTSGAQQRWELKLRSRNQPDLNIMLAVVRSNSPYEGEPELLWQLQDMTEYKQREQAEYEQFFRATFEQSPVGMGHIGAKGQWLHVNATLCELLGYSADELQYRSFFDLTLVNDRAETHALFKQLVSGQFETIKQEKQYQTKQGEFIDTITNVTAVRTPSGEFLYAIAVFEDITERKRAEAAERKQRLLAETLHDSALALTASLDSSEVTDLILTNIGRLVPHDAASLLLLDGETAHVERARGYGEAGAALEADLQNFQISIAESDRIDQMLRTKNPVLISHWEDHGSWDQVPGMTAMRSVVAAPILNQDEVVGFLKLHSRTPNFFTPDHAHLLQVFAAQAAIAIQNARAHEDAQALAVLNERHRLARELHDAVTQTLFSASMIADSLPRLWENTPDPVQTQLEQLQLLTRGALAEMRTLLLELRPEYLANLDLETQVRLLLDALRVRKRIDITLTAQMHYLAPNEVRIAFYRIVQEALNNIIKHAHATAVQVILESHDHHLELAVEDNGVGFEYDGTEQGFGLHIIHERADFVGALVKIISHPDSGTKICVTWDGTVP